MSSGPSSTMVDPSAGPAGGALGDSDALPVAANRAVIGAVPGAPLPAGRWPTSSSIPSPTRVGSFDASSAACRGSAGVAVEAGEHARPPAHGRPASLGRSRRRPAGLLEARLLGQDLLQRRLALGRQLVEPDAHPRRDVRPRRIVLADPYHRPLAGEQ